MYHLQEYPAKRLSPMWKRIVTLIEGREYNQAKKEMEFLYKETNRIISIMEEEFRPNNSWKPRNRRIKKK